MFIIYILMNLNLCLIKSNMIEVVATRHWKRIDIDKIRNNESYRRCVDFSEGSRYRPGGSGLLQTYCDTIRTGWDLDILLG